MKDYKTGKIYHCTSKTDFNIISQDEFNKQFVNQPAKYKLFSDHHQPIIYYYEKNIFTYSVQKFARCILYAKIDQEHIDINNLKVQLNETYDKL